VIETQEPTPFSSCLTVTLSHAVHTNTWQENFSAPDHTPWICGTSDVGQFYKTNANNCYDSAGCQTEMTISYLHLHESTEKLDKTTQLVTISSVCELNYHPVYYRIGNFSGNCIIILLELLPKVSQPGTYEY
jgi:hypothetical protein